MDLHLPTIFSVSHTLQCDAHMAEVSTNMYKAKLFCSISSYLLISREWVIAKPAVVLLQCFLFS